MKSAIILFFSMFTLLLSSQSIEKIDTTDFLSFAVYNDLEDARYLAKTHIEKGKPLMLLQSGLAQVIYNSDKDFEKMYGVLFHDEGCTSLMSRAFMEAYNVVIFDFITEAHGKKWIKEVRSDVIGFKAWKKRNR